MFYKFKSVIPCETYSYTQVRDFLGLELLSGRRRNVGLMVYTKLCVV